MKYLKIIVFLICMNSICLSAGEENQISVTAPMTTDLAGNTYNIALQSIVRILCYSTNKSGTGFFHKSGNIITAAHILNGSSHNDVIIVKPDGSKYEIKEIIIDSDFDLALLIPTKKISSQSLPISKRATYNIGAQVSTWGYPSGYSGFIPLLSSGYLSGLNNKKLSSGKYTKELVVNAAFNLGNSGGPLIDIEHKEIIGVVTSKHAPLPDYIQGALKALKNSSNILQYTKTKSDGTKEQISEGQLLEEILQYLRSQTQLVIGYAATSSNLRLFLGNNGIE